jgi:hypothetical protein
MISHSRTICVARQPIDLRSGINRLLSIAKQANLDPQKGDIAVFSGRNRKRLKVLHGDTTGIWLSVKMFTSEKARSRVAFLDDEMVTEVTSADLAVLLEGATAVEMLSKRAKS